MADVALSLQGDLAGFTQLVQRLQPQVFRWALVFSADADEADDIAQETFVLLYRRLGQYRGDAPLEGWLYRIVRRAAHQRSRTRRRRAHLATSPGARPERDVYVTDPGARVDREQVAALIRSYFLELPPRQREIFDLVDLQGYEPAEVARMTALNPATVRGNLFKARAAIRARLIASHPTIAGAAR